MKLEKSVILVWVLIGVILAGTVFGSWYFISLAKKKKELKARLEEEAKAQPEYNITVVIKPYQYGKKRVCKGVWRPCLTALDATKECDKAANLGLKLRYDPKIHKAYLVDEIMGLRHTDQINRYWLYYVNNVFVTTKAVDLLNDPARTCEGKKSEPMPERFYLKPGDIVEWRFEEWVTLKEELQQKK
jgi:hypothetical protein